MEMSVNIVKIDSTIERFNDKYTGLRRMPISPGSGVSVRSGKVIGKKGVALDS